jgi:hypothetical protein
LDLCDDLPAVDPEFRGGEIAIGVDGDAGPKVWAIPDPCDECREAGEGQQEKEAAAAPGHRAIR